MFEAIVSGIFGDKSPGWQPTLRCPYFLCPSNQPIVGAHQPRMKFIERMAPSVYQYKCKDCSCLVNVSVENDKDGRESWKINPAFVSGKPSYNWK